MSDVKELAAHLLAELAPAVAAMVKAEIVQHIRSAPVVALAESAVDMVAHFAELDPGIGGAPPAVAEGSDPEARLTALEAKVDALVQATGHGSSAALAAHL